MGANDSSWQGIGNREAKSTAAAKNSIHIPESAYANLANILIGDSRAQAALGIFRDSGRESNIGAQINNRCGPSQAPAGVHSGRPFRSSQKEENIVSESDDEVVEVQHSVTVPVSMSRARPACFANMYSSLTNGNGAPPLHTTDGRAFHVHSWTGNVRKHHHRAIHQAILMRTGIQRASLSTSPETFGRSRPNFRWMKDLGTKNCLEIRPNQKG